MSRQAWSRRIKFFVMRYASIEAALEELNAYASQVPCSGLEVKRFNTSKGDSAVAQLQSGTQKWLGTAVSPFIMNIVVTKPQYSVQVKCFQSDNLDKLEQEINAFAEKHEVTKIAVMYDEKSASGGVVVLVTYAYCV